MYHNIIEELDLVILFCFVKLGMGLKWLPEQVTKKNSFSKTKKTVYVETHGFTAFAGILQIELYIVGLR